MRYPEYPEANKGEKMTDRNKIYIMDCEYALKIISRGNMFLNLVSKCTIEMEIYIVGMNTTIDWEIYISMCNSKSQGNTL
jgi:hypothetical protein